MTNLDPSTPQIYKETWVVRVGRETFSLSGNEMNLVLDAIKSGNRGIVQLKDRGFSIAHLESYWLETKERNQLKLDRPEAVVRDDEKKLIKKKLDEIRSKYPFIKRGNKK